MSEQVKDMALVEHLGELRKRIIVVLVVFVAGLIGGFLLRSRSIII